MDTTHAQSLSELVLQSFYPLFYGVVASALYFVCIRLPFDRRLFALPALIGVAILSLTSSWRLAWLNGAENLWALSVCGWILHSISSLGIERRSPQDACPAPRLRL